MYAQPSRTTGTPLVLDRRERCIIRHELTKAAGEAADLELVIANGNRHDALDLLNRCDEILAALDTIGWAEQDDAPDRQPIDPAAALVNFAASETAALDHGIATGAVLDEDLDHELDVRSVLDRVARAA